MTSQHRFSSLSRSLTWRRARWALAGTVVPVLWACSSHPLQAPTAVPQQEIPENYEVNPIRDVDLLVMIDASGSMADKQANVKANFTKLVTELRSFQGGLPNVHIGVVTSDVGAGNVFLPNNPACNQHGGDQGKLHVGSNCGLNDPNSHFIVSLNNETMNNYTGKLEDVFTCMASVGTSGCGFEHQLQSSRLALAANFNAENAGFLRDDALLALVLVTDEDDCSAPPVSNLFSDNTTFDPNVLDPNARCYIKAVSCNGTPLPDSPSMNPLTSCAATIQPEPPGAEDLYPVSEFVDFFKALKPDNKLVVAGIIGWPDADKVAGATYAIAPSSQFNGHTLNDIAPVCDGGGTNGKGWPGVRVKTFIDSFKNSTVYSICNSDFGPALTKIGDIIKTVLDPGCITTPLVDTDPNTAGIQPECDVLDRVPTGSGSDTTDKPLPSCASNNNSPPCWTLQAPGDNGNTCMNNAFHINVNRGGMDATKGTEQVVRCLACVANHGALGCPCSGTTDCASKMCNNGACTAP